MRPRLLSLLLSIAPLPLLIAPGACGHGGSPAASVGCNRPAASAAGPSQASVSAAASLALEVPDAGLPHAIDRGCAQDISTSIAASAQLEAAGRTCAPSMTTLLAPKGYAASPEQSATARIELARHACVRIGIATDQAGLAVEARLKGPAGSSEGWWRSVTPMLIAGAGPVCVREAGSYAIEARPNASANVWIAAWGTQTPTP